ncbi:hypothetical protein EUX98_g4820 [Antrodiella citrinella]|uniref:glutathione synthase n=1 Tax=Antrodiella citrinella TaxID=2447956 RepID=A0A4S4MT29_9APHY|nr:hypothetical protein EUX98_g4820 [Antrodiella citrinella]
MCDVYLSPRSLDDDTPDHVDRIRSLTELRITCRIIHSVSLPDVSNLLSLFGVVERLHLCGFPAIHPGYDRYRYDKSTIRGLEPKCIIVNDPACYGPLLLKLCTSPAISYVDSFVVSVGASQPNWDEVAHLVEAAGEGLKHLTCVHMLQCITCDDIGIGHCPNLETITFQFFVHDDQWFFPNYKRWECIFRFLSSLAATYRNWPNLHTIIFSISTRDILLHYRPSTRDQPWLRAVEGVILQLAHSRLLSPRMIRDQEYLRDRWGNTAKLQLKIVPHCKIGHPISRFEECEEVMGQSYQWPPDITESQLETLTLLATTYALSHGLVYLPVAEVQPSAPTSTIHAPLSLFPSPIPRKQFEKAKNLQSLYNVLYSRVATDIDFLDRVMGEEQGVGQVDEFTGSLWKQWKRLRDREAGIVQPLQLGLFRSDYMLHAPEGADSAILKQVEFNTISSSFGTLSQQCAQMHKYLFSSTKYFGCSPHLTHDNLPQNTTTAGLAKGLAAAHTAYGVSTARILFVVQPNERNVFDQRFLEYELLESHSIHVIRQTFDELAASAQVDPQTHVLKIKLNTSVLSDLSSVEISTVYFRAGYTPNDYTSPSHYDTRGLLESSLAIQCPSIPLQLAGGKKVQEELTKPGVLERFLFGDKYAKTFTPEDLVNIRSTWMEMWSLDSGGDDGVVKARTHAANLVLKPQREGGGNNVYKEAIPPFLDTLPEKERTAWIAMRLITTPKGLGNYLVRAGGGTNGAVKANVISELGLFGWALFGGKDGAVQEKEAGWLVRTKGEDSNEGGVAAGFSVLDSIVLVD